MKNDEQSKKEKLSQKNVATNACEMSGNQNSPNLPVMKEWTKVTTTFRKVTKPGLVDNSCKQAEEVNFPCEVIIVVDKAGVVGVLVEDKKVDKLQE